MSLAPDHDLIKAAIEALKAAPALVPLVGDRIYDRPSDKAAALTGIASPYISMGPTSMAPAYADCSDAVEVTMQFDIWSWGGGEAFSSAECRTVLEAVRKTLHQAELILEDNALPILVHELSRVLRDADGVTNHGVIQFTATVETP